MQSTEIVTNSSYNTDTDGEQQEEKLQTVSPELYQQQQVQQHVRAGSAAARLLVKDLVTRHLETVVGDELHHRLLRYLDLVKYHTPVHVLEVLHNIFKK